MVSGEAVVGAVGKPARQAPSQTLSAQERRDLLTELNSERFVDEAPRTIYATLLDEGRYLCSWRTMYRILKAEDALRERRDQRRHPEYRKPELLATKPRQLWSWDITKMRGPQKWTYFHLYLIIDVFSRYIVGWIVMEVETGELAAELIAQTCAKEGIEPGQLIVHADRGSSMTSKTVGQLMLDLGVTKTHSRPYVSNDNPYSEAQFKTLKYRPSYPDRFGCIADARNWVHEFVTWANYEHRHSGIGLLTPATVHLGLTEEVRAERQVVLQAAYEAHPQRFGRGRPVPPAGPTAVWINAPLVSKAKVKVVCISDHATATTSLITQAQVSQTP